MRAWELTQLSVSIDLTDELDGTGVRLTIPKGKPNLVGIAGHKHKLKWFRDLLIRLYPITPETDPKPNQTMKKSHPGFSKSQHHIAMTQGVSLERAGAILAAGARNASKSAHRKNPRLNRVRGK